MTKKTDAHKVVIRSRQSVPTHVNPVEGVTSAELIPRWSFRDESLGSYLEFVHEFEIAQGARPQPHVHDSHQFYFILEGTGAVQIEDEARRVKPGDFVHIPRNLPHAIWPTGEGDLRALSFACSYQDPAAGPFVNTSLPKVELRD